ncbi:MAG: NAD(P)-binding domain-containing protein [Bauldia sp.]|nr:NAD(P)-binding domain-containing protein [Bauldia sp.]
MKVGILGTGPVGRALGHGFVTLGYETKLGAREAGNPKAAEWAAAHPGLGSAGTFSEAAAFGDVVVVATLGTVLPQVAAAAGPEHFAGKVVIDTTNPLDMSRGFPPGLAISGNDSGGETLQRALPDAFVVKAFNTMNNGLMFRPHFDGGPPAMMIAGNDAAAKATVTRLLADFGWPALDLGNITSARWLEAMCIAWCMVGVATGKWDHAFQMVHGTPAAPSVAD